MNRKAFLILLALLVVLGGAGLALFQKDLAVWRGTDTKIGSRLFEKLPVNEVVQINVIDATGAATLVLKDQRWVVKERGDYLAHYADISELLNKLPEVKVVQTEEVGSSLLPRLKLVAPDAKKDSKDAENAATRLELIGKDGKPLASLMLGKKVIKIEDSPLPIKQEKPVGRYVLYPGNPTVLVISDALNSAEAKPERWLAKDFFKVDKIKSLTVSGEGATWKLARAEEYGRWAFADAAGGQLDHGAVSAATKALTGLSFNDIVLDAKDIKTEKPRTLVAETFDKLTYTIKIARKVDSDDYVLNYTVSGEPPRERTPEKGEKAADKERSDKYFAEDLKRLDERLKLEKSLMTWTYLVAAKTLDPIFVDRASLVAEKKPSAPSKK
jgi:Domain of unknown function (DUF4340)